MKNLTLIVALAAAATLSTMNLNAAEPACAYGAKACCHKTVAVTTDNPRLIERNTGIAASPKVLANFPHLAKGRQTQPNKPVGACNCCKS